MQLAHPERAGEHEVRRAPRGEGAGDRRGLCGEGSAERVVHRDSSILPFYMLRTTTRILRGLQVDKYRMLENLNSGGGIVFSGRGLLALVESGMGRDEAYAVVQGAAMRAWEGEGGFRELLKRDDEVCGRLGDDLDRPFDPAYELRNLGVVFERVERLRGRLQVV